MRYGHAKLFYGVLLARSLLSPRQVALLWIRQDFLFLLHERLQESMVLGHYHDS